jgi:hypothetical protein
MLAVQAFFLFGISLRKIRILFIEVILMGKWNEQAAPNNNLPSKTIKQGELVGNEAKHEFSEELSDGGERNQNIKVLRNNGRAK